MSTRLTVSITLVLLAVFLIMGLAVWDFLPNLMASHWNINDQVDGYISKFWGVFLVPIMAAGIFVLFLILPQIDPLQANIAKFREAFNLFIVLMMLFFLYLWVLTVVWNLGYTGFRMSTAMLPAMGLLFVYVGYMLRKAKRNFFIGIRTPWTLSSDTVWDKTHKLGSTLFIISGALALVGSLFGKNAIWFVMIPLLGSSLFLVIYSYLLYQQETKL